MHIGKISQLLEVWVFHQTQVEFGVYGPHNTAGDLQNTPGTPAKHFPLAASGSQSALYSNCQLHTVAHNYIQLHGFTGTQLHTGTRHQISQKAIRSCAQLHKCTYMCIDVCIRHVHIDMCIYMCTCQPRYTGLELSGHG